mmetsp:Transcript_10891/g.21530  ORF Transcript_10891/g.21530 Transcript_10891/m.21530 type:complete len:153 (-) Transcript_10891:2766-3224(-)
MLCDNEISSYYLVDQSRCDNLFSLFLLLTPPVKSTLLEELERRWLWLDFFLLVVLLLLSLVLRDDLCDGLRDDPRDNWRDDLCPPGSSPPPRPPPKHSRLLLLLFRARLRLLLLPLDFLADDNSSLDDDRLLDDFLPSSWDALLDVERKALL